MKMGSPWIQQQALSKPQNVPTWGTWRSKNYEATANLVRAPKGSRLRNPPLHLDNLITIIPTTSWLLIIKEKNVSQEHSLRGSVLIRDAQTPHKTKLIQYMMMGSP
jgi:hypothetical protein